MISNDGMGDVCGRDACGEHGYKYGYGYGSHINAHERFDGYGDGLYHFSSDDNSIAFMVIDDDYDDKIRVIGI